MANLERMASTLGPNPTITVGISIIESALKQLPEFGVQRLGIVPPNRMSVSVRVALSVLGRDLVLYPDALVELTVVDGHIQLAVVGVNLFGVNIPPALIQQQLGELVQGPEREANGAVQEVTNKTGLKLNALSLTENSLVLTFG